MRYYKIIEDSYILAIGTGEGGIEITQEKYTQIMSIINDRPTPPSGKDYRLNESLEWEEYDVPPKEIEELATEEDYQSALAEFGVKL